ncbi:MAG: hypothetical protein KAR42_16205 [candidate division Zixibacteria bacterium]|nr:hypothetical protein [candidate division Zixibacteria bacterium]
MVLTFLDKCAYFLNKTRCWFGVHTFPLYAEKFISIDPFDIDEGGYGYWARCYVCEKVKQEWIYHGCDDYLTPPGHKGQYMHEQYKVMLPRKLTSELVPM